MAFLGYFLLLIYICKSSSAIGFMFMQGELFTAKQAKSCGYIRSNHHYQLKQVL